MSYKQSEIAILKACALKQFNSEDFFIIYDENEEIIGAYEGSEDEAKGRYENEINDWDSFEDYLKQNYTEVEPIGGDEERESHIVLTNDEADEKASEYIKDSLWAFNAEFIIDHSKLPYDAIDMIKTYQEEKCEGANETIEALIEDMEEFVNDAISADGRGHFLNTYDGNENEETVEGETFYIYRM